MWSEVCVFLLMLDLGLWWSRRVMSFPVLNFPYFKLFMLCSILCSVHVLDQSYRSFEVCFYYTIEWPNHDIVLLRVYLWIKFELKLSPCSSPVNGNTPWYNICDIWKWYSSNSQKGLIWKWWLLPTFGDTRFSFYSPRSNIRSGCDACIYISILWYIIVTRESTTQLATFPSVIFPPAQPCEL